MAEFAFFKWESNGTVTSAAEFPVSDFAHIRYFLPAGACLKYLRMTIIAGQPNQMALMRIDRWRHSCFTLRCH